MATDSKTSSHETSVSVTLNTETNHRKNSILTGVITLAVGITLIICNKMISGLLVVTLAGILFILAGILNLLIYVMRKDAAGKRINSGFTFFLGWFVSIAAIVLGVSMLVFTDTFNHFVPLVFGLFLFLGAAMLCYVMLFVVRKLFKVPGWLWAFPIAMLILGIIVITRNPQQDDALIMILTGSALAVYGMASLFIASLRSGARRAIENEEIKKEEHGA